MRLADGIFGRVAAAMDPVLLNLSAEEFIAYAEQWTKLERDGLELIRAVAPCLSETPVRIIDQAAIPELSQSRLRGFTGADLDEIVRPFLTDAARSIYCNRIRPPGVRRFGG